MRCSSGCGSRSSSARAVIIIPGVQKPHCRPWQRMKPSWTGSRTPSVSRSSTVRTSRPPAIAASTVQVFTGSPSIQATQVPQLLVSQPQWVPVSPSSSRRKCTSSIRPSTSRVTLSPLTVMVTCISSRLPGWFPGRRRGRPRSVVRRSAASAGSARRRGAACSRRCRGCRSTASSPRQPARPLARRARRSGVWPRSASEIAGMPVVLGPTAASPTRASVIDAVVHPHGGARGGHRPVTGSSFDLGVGARATRTDRAAGSR